MTDSPSNDTNNRPTQEPEDAEHQNAAAPDDAPLEFDPDKPRFDPALGYFPAANLSHLFFDPFFTRDESVTQFELLLDEVRGVVQPQNIVEFAWTTSAAIAIYRIVLMNRRKAEVLKELYYRAVEEVLIEIADGSEVEQAREVLRIQARQDVKTLRTTGELNGDADSLPHSTDTISERCRGASACCAN